MKETVRAESVECYFCKHLFSDESIILNHACKAYPFGIPSDLILGYVTHHEIREDQEGEYVFSRSTS